MPVGDLVIRGAVRTVDDAQPTAEALAVADWRIVAVGNRADVDTWIGPGTQTLDPLAWLNGEAPDTPLVIIHNSGHKAFFNTAPHRAQRSGDRPEEIADHEVRATYLAGSQVYTKGN